MTMLELLRKLLSLLVLNFVDRADILSMSQRSKSNTLNPVLLKPWLWPASRWSPMSAAICIGCRYFLPARLC
jgi:hypothetical protein